jgi:hypothetical protein
MASAEYWKPFSGSSQGTEFPPDISSRTKLEMPSSPCLGSSPGGAGIFQIRLTNGGITRNEENPPSQDRAPLKPGTRLHCTCRSPPKPKNHRQPGTRIMKHGNRRFKEPSLSIPVLILLAQDYVSLGCLYQFHR